MNALSPDYLISGMVDRGLPEHVARAFVLNFQDESGLNPGINEAAPIVPGSRGGFGLSQWTGPRRRALEAYAAERGQNVANPDLQLDFLMTELRGSEAAAAKAILAAPDTETAAAAIVNKFLRPAEEHRARRERAYLGGKPLPSGGDTPSAPSNALAGYEPRQIDPVALIEGRRAPQMDMPMRSAQPDPGYAYQMPINALAPVGQYDNRRYLTERLMRG